MEIRSRKNNHVTVRTFYKDPMTCLETKKIGAWEPFFFSLRDKGPRLKKKGCFFSLRDKGSRLKKEPFFFSLRDKGPKTEEERFLRKFLLHH